MRFLSALIVFIFTASYSQSYKADMFYGRFRDVKYNTDENLADEYEVTGNVKKITSREISYVTFKKSDKYNPFLYDSITKGNFRSGSILEFNKNHQLLLKYRLCENDSVQLSEKHVYNEKNLEIENESHFRDFTYSEKFVYADNLLREKWIKSSHQKEYFLRERYTYDAKNQIIRKEDLSNNIDVDYRPHCKAGYLDTDSINYYFYDTEGNLTRSECRVFSYEANFKGPPDESLFTLNSIFENTYVDGKITSKTIINVNDNKKTTTTYTYDDTGKLILEEKVIPGRRPLRCFTKYYYKNHKLFSIEYGFGAKVNSTYYYEDDVLRKFETKNHNGIAEYRIYNEKGILIKHSRDGKIYDYVYAFDPKGNWISYSEYRNNVLINKKIREIEYYD